MKAVLSFSTLQLSVSTGLTLSGSVIYNQKFFSGTPRKASQEWGRQLELALFAFPQVLHPAWDVDMMAGAPAASPKIKFNMCKITCIQGYLLQHYL